MGKALRSIKRGRKSPSPLDPNILKAYNAGLVTGAKDQNEADRQHLVMILSQLEEIPGIGNKTADKVREFFLKEFGK